MSPIPTPPSPGHRRILFCSFCETPKHEVAFLITGPRAGICGDCLDAAAVVVSDWRAAKPKPAEPGK